MNDFIRVLLINLGIFGVLAALLMLTSKDGGAMAFYVGAAQALINFVLMIVFFVNRKTQQAIGSLVSMILILIIGFGLCLATFSLH